MWMSKFLDFKDEIAAFPDKIKASVLGMIKKQKLSPLEFTILEQIFNKGQISGYDLMQNLNKHFAGTWQARSGTIYPILSKLKRNGYLISTDVKSPIGPVVKLYRLTQAGERLIKAKVSNNFDDQMKFLENFMIELSSIYIQSFPEAEREDKTAVVKELLKNTLETVMNEVPKSRTITITCPKCSADLTGKTGSFCDQCGAEL